MFVAFCYFLRLQHSQQVARALWHSLNGKNRFTALSVYHSSLILVDKIDILTCLKISTSQTLTSRYPINNFDPGKKYQQSTECRREVGKKYISRYVIPIGIPRNCLVSYCRIRDDKESCLTILYLHIIISRDIKILTRNVSIETRFPVSKLSAVCRQIGSRFEQKLQRIGINCVCVKLVFCWWNSQA